MTRFEEEFKKLNAKQQEAVGNIDGPLLVVAGPGTGKTQLLSMRAAQILRESDALPRNILCLTFTEKAATNMKDRMLSLIGPEARNIVVKTFHGLGAELINSYPEYFWSGAKLQPAPEVIKREIIEEILRKRPLHDPLTLKFAGNYTLVASIIKDIEQAKKAGLNPDMLQAVAAMNVAYLESIESSAQDVLVARISKNSVEAYKQLLEELPDIQSGDLTIPLQPISEVLKRSLQEAIDEAEAEGKGRPLSEWKRVWTVAEDGRRVFSDLKRSKRIVALSEVYREYQKRMHERGYFDYSDMILETITQLVQQEELLSQVQERFSYIMIDEFQDTNDAQFRLAYLIANSPVHEGRPNIMAVGDDDQAIYRFQGAELSNIESFVRAFEDTEEIVLTDNYRSHGDVLEASAEVARLIEHRLVNERDHLDKTIVAKNEDIEAGKIYQVIYESWAHQMSGVAELVKEAFESSKESIAVIARGHKSLEELAGILHREGVPIRYERKSNILIHPVVELVAQISELIEAIAEGDLQLVNALLADVIVHPAFGVEPIEAYRFAVRMRHERARDWLSELSEAKPKQMRNLARGLLELSGKSRELPAAVVVEYILGLREVAGYNFPLKSYYLEDRPRDSLYMEALSALQRVRSLVLDFSQSVQPKLADFSRFLRLNQRHSIVIADQSVFVSSNHSVELMSAHGAKGLEFDRVFIIDGTDREWSPSSRGNRPPSNLEALAQYGESADDYARLMFVALTRARSSIVVSSYRRNDEGRPMLPTPYIQHLPVREHAPTLSDTEVIERATRWPLLSTDELALLLSPLLESYQLSVTHLINYLDIEEGGPEYFIERNLLRLPEEKAAHLGYGSAIHAGLEAAHRLVNGAGQDIEKVVEAFAQQLSREQMDPIDEKRFLEQGERLLRELIEQQKVLFKKGDQPERNIGGLQLEGAVIQGKLDVVRDEGSDLRIIDYKTGQPPASLTTTSKTDGLKAYRHRLQLIFYAVMAQDAGIAKASQRIIGEMVYVESEQQKRFSMEYEVSSEEIAKMRKLIAAVYGRIIALDMPAIDTYPSGLAGVQAFEEDLINNSLEGGESR